MDINDIKQTKFFISHIWPGMIDVKCSKCGKMIGSLQNSEIIQAGKKVFITKKKVACNSCGESIPVGRLIAETGQDLNNLVITSKVEKELKAAEENEERKLEAAKEAAQLLLARQNITATTSSYVEGHYITNYLGIVSGASIYNVGGLLGGGYTDKGQNSMFSVAIRIAEKIMLNDAFMRGANAVVGIQTALGGSATMNQIVVTLTGTAVKTEKITEGK